MTREREAAELDRRILEAIASWDFEEADFDRLARDLFVHQARWNPPYAAFARACGYDPLRPPATWREIPAVPTLAFALNESPLAAFPVESAALLFETSGTTRGNSGRHALETTALYDASLLAGFDRFMLGDLPRDLRLRYLLLVPPRAHSSLGYMMERILERRGDGLGGNYLREEGVDAERFAADATQAYSEERPVCIA
ncbi:MAG: hypothetical protein JO101_01785, partial [Candidatus Eremiobacteraeota bacterium]|nr:hypothetical protein [Candidatus Eremiobacteraeota bacterium]MBV8354024.1 hypothetical protein [Candidatus Eremiobacteraeota bacterium]